VSGVSVVVMVVAVGAVVAFGVWALWYLFARGAQATTVSRREFDQEYDALVAAGDAVEAEREAAWRDFHGWQVDNERERLSWEEAPGE
jgi:hypothetical protein